MNTETLVMMAEIYSAHTGLKLATISTYAKNDGKFFRDLKEKNAGCTLKTASRVMQWFSDNWADDLEWPKSVPRPAKSKDAA
ncbi:hypothetical protein [Yoonia sp.]|uniref:hypothetical protein n=1 Tax=Yoonia sp. TaxID=2212373 RepID=UPI00358E0E8A